MGLIKRKANAVLEGDHIPPEQQQQREQALLNDLHTMRARFNEYIEAKTQALKASRDGAALPINYLRAQLTGGECLCQTIARLLGDPDA